MDMPLLLTALRQPAFPVKWISARLNTAAAPKVFLPLTVLTIQSASCRNHSLSPILRLLLLSIGNYSALSQLHAEIHLKSLVTMGFPHS